MLKLLYRGLACAWLTATLACSASGDDTGGSGGNTGLGGSGGWGGGIGGMGQGGTGQPASPVPPQPSLTGGYQFVFGDVVFEVNPNVGGRITTLSLGGINLLTGPAVDPLNYGSTFWTSPQSMWGWPAPTEIDSSPYTATVEGTTLTLTGQPSPALGVSVTKQFAADAATGFVAITYTINNHTAAPVMLAPWEVTRVPVGGLAFFPAGSALPSPDPSWVSPERALQPDPVAIWLDTAGLTAQSKWYADGAGGWLAYVTNGLLFVKVFQDVALGSHAPGEAEIELYTNGQYLELEVQGPYSSISPGVPFPWTVYWLVTLVPATVPVQVGSVDLVNYVNTLLQ